MIKGCVLLGSDDLTSRMVKRALQHSTYSKVFNSVLVRTSRLNMIWVIQVIDNFPQPK